MIKNNKNITVGYRRIILLLVCAFFTQMLFAESTVIETLKYKPTWKSIATAPVPEWYDDAKFGIFVVWGPYSIPAFRGNKGGGYAEWFPKYMYSNNPVYKTFMEKRFGAIPPDFGYKDVCKMFKAEKFDPEEWADMFEKSGAKYVIQIGEFHAGFVMWNSELTDWCATKMGPMRDIVGDVGQAVRKRGLKYGISTHRDRHYQFFSKKNPAIAEEIRREPAAEGLYGPFEISEEYMLDHTARWQELIDKYQPDFMWLDNFVGDSEAWKLWRKHSAISIANYLNQAQKRGQAVYFNNKGGKQNFPTGAGVRSYDNMNIKSLPETKWENPATMSTSYGFCEKEETGNWYRTPTELIQLLCDVVSKNGNLLLTVGPKGDGSISERQRVRLIEMGKWLKVNGEAIYGTRPWKEFAEGEGKAPKPRMHSVPIRPKEIRYTLKGDVLYALSLAKPEFPLVLTKTKGFDKNAVKDITLLGSEQNVEWTVTENGISINGPAKLEGKHVWAFKIEKAK